MALLAQLTVATLATWFIASSLWIYPHSLSYFNESIGGPLNGPEHLLGSNVDWGQDLYYMKSWCEDNRHARPLYLAYNGLFDASAVGFDFARPIDQAVITTPSTSAGFATIPSGWYAVSVNHLFGQDFFKYESPPEKVRMIYSIFRTLRASASTEMIGTSVYLFHVRH